MDIQITSPYGVKLLTAGKRCEEDITATIDKSLLPSGELTVTENGTYDVYNKETVVVNTPQYPVYNGAYEVNKSGYTVTLVWSANRGESAGYSASYTADNGESGTLSIDNANVTLTNVTSLTLNLPGASYSFAHSTTGNLNSNIGENIIEITEDQTITVFVSNATGGGAD